eukprot:362322-Chlamydomonas_euryale.AAC.4
MRATQAALPPTLPPLHPTAAAASPRMPELPLLSRNDQADRGAAAAAAFAGGARAGARRGARRGVECLVAAGLLETELDFSCARASSSSQGRQIHGNQAAWRAARVDARLMAREPGRWQ